jgi:glutaredoxin 3
LPSGDELMTHILLYTKAYCGFCLAAKRLLGRKGLVFEEIDVEFDDAKHAEMRARAGGRSTVPQIFIHPRAARGRLRRARGARALRLTRWVARARA